MIRILILMSLSLFLIQCEDKEMDDIYSAQICLNSATSATVDTCVQKVAGYSSPLAFRIRCGADFIRQNITDSRIVDATDRLDNNNDATKDPMAHMMAFITFDTEANVDLAIANCTAAGSEGMLNIAYMSKLATVFITGLGVAFLPDGSVDPNTLDAALDAANSGSLTNAQKESIGSTVALAYPNYCGDSGAFKDEEVCVNLNNSINAGSNIAIAEALLTQLKNDN